jgi:hypothetical protein
LVDHFFTSKTAWFGSIVQSLCAHTADECRLRDGLFVIILNKPNTRVTSQKRPENNGLPVFRILHRKLYVKLILFGETASLLFFNVRFEGLNDPEKCRRNKDPELKTVLSMALHHSTGQAADQSSWHELSEFRDYSINQARLKV